MVKAGRDPEFDPDPGCAAAGDAGFEPAARWRGLNASTSTGVPGG